MRTLGTRARACIKARQRPPVPMQPTLMRSLAPAALAAGAANAAPVVRAEDFRKERRDREIIPMLFLLERFGRPHLTEPDLQTSIGVPDTAQQESAAPTWENTSMQRLLLLATLLTIFAVDRLGAGEFSAP